MIHLNHTSVLLVFDLRLRRRLRRRVSFVFATTSENEHRGKSQRK
jgi:hypothetical protein